jgi:hypothetical protein
VLKEINPVTHFPVKKTKKQQDTALTLTEFIKYIEELKEAK